MTNEPTHAMQHDDGTATFLWMEETMKKEVLESPTKEQVLKAAESCPDAKVALKELYPSVFKEGKEEARYCCDGFECAVERYRTIKLDTAWNHYVLGEQPLWYCHWCGKKLIF